MAVLEALPSTSRLEQLRIRSPEYTPSCIPWDAMSHRGECDVMGFCLRSPWKFVLVPWATMPVASTVDFCT